ncbi:hypothetical protein B0H11DRAFT_2296276 [Mycena galericulata]|nr:hypothetical protein B0H11DRAFT_2296276 [Mycena galericulata]
MSETTDRTWHKALVAFLVILDTFDTVLTCHILYFYLVSNYLAPQALEFPVWSAVLHVAVTAFSNFIVRGAYARRVYGLSKGNILGTLWILLLSLFNLCEEQDTSFTALTSYPPAITVKAFGMETFMQVESLSTLMYLNFAANSELASNGTPLATSAGLELTIDDAALFKDLNAVIKCFDTAIKKSRSRARKSARAEADDDDVEDDIEDS